MDLRSSSSLRRRFGRDTRGIAALEFALILPFTLLLYLGGFDVMKMVRAYDKTQVAAKSLGDLIAQETTAQPITQAEVSLLLSAAKAVATPYGDGNFLVTVSAIDLKLQGTGPSATCCTATVRWSATSGGALRPCNTTLRQIDNTVPWALDTIPVKLGTQPIITVAQVATYVASIIAVDVTYNNTAITPLIAPFATRAIQQHDYAVPRTLGQITVAPTGGSQPVAMTGLAAGQSGSICS